jgi:hypothetical protein
MACRSLGSGHGNDTGIRDPRLPRPLRRGAGRRRLLGAAACYALPALVVGDAGDAGAHRAQGLVGIRPELRAVDPFTPALTLADVRWAYLDEARRARQHTTYRYPRRRSGTGELGIQVVIDTTA